MSIQRHVQGGKVRWKVQVRQGRTFIGGKTFDTKRDAERWEAAEKAKLVDGYNPRLGRVSLGDYADEWLNWRSERVQRKTHQADAQMHRLLPTWLLRLQLSAVNPKHVEKWQDGLVADGLARGSVIRHRQALSGVFSRAVEEGRLVNNPVARAATPPILARPQEIHPFSADEVYAVADEIARTEWELAEVVLLAFWSGCRWSELRSLRVRDFSNGRAPVLRVSRSQPEGGAVKVTKSGRSRAVPLYEGALPILARAAAGKRPDDLLLTTARGAQLHRTAFVRSTRWKDVAQGRRIHDLRHSAICWWLSSGLPLHTVKAMAGHASITTTEMYLHHVGDKAAMAAVDLLNRSGRTEGALALNDN